MRSLSALMFGAAMKRTPNAGQCNLALVAVSHHVGRQVGAAAGDVREQFADPPAGERFRDGQCFTTLDEQVVHHFRQ